MSSSSSSLRSCLSVLKHETKFSATLLFFTFGQAMSASLPGAVEEPCEPQHGKQFSLHPSHRTSQKTLVKTGSSPWQQCQFMVPLEEKYRCEACRDVLQEPRQTACGHRFCLQCITTILSQARPACPIDDEILRPDEVFTDNCCRREILVLRVHCPNEKQGCKTTPSLSTLNEHLSNCHWEPVQCSFHGCPQRPLRKYLEQHIASCPLRQRSCKFCLLPISLTDTKKHYETQCQKYLIPCPNHCDKGDIPRDELPTHLSCCPYRQAECSFSTCGCIYKGTLQGLKEHEEAALQHHLALVTSRNTDLELKVAVLHSQLVERGQVIEQLVQKVRQLEREILAQGQAGSKQEARLSNTQRMLAMQTEKLLKLQDVIQLSSKNDDQHFLHKGVQSMRDDIANLKARVEHFEENRTNRTQDENFGTMESSLNRHNEQLRQHDARLLDMDLRFQVMETTSYNSKLIWKIRDYSRRKLDAVTGKTLSLYSQPFYTSAFGYKMCARVYLNGDGMGRGTHLSLFFVVMRGEYDALLPWPFRQRVTLTLMDQGVGRKHLSDTFKPDPSSTSFSRPASDMNIASGCPLFVSHDLLKTGSYVCDDTIFIKVVVDNSDLAEP
uniref:TNF receptor-associated factor n=2 Tax=Eptatretus burgeri TaxID=7764 RepID=A0A8C4R0W9_EPTBU